MTPVECDRIARHKAAHDFTQRGWARPPSFTLRRGGQACAQQEMKMPARHRELRRGGRGLESRPRPQLNSNAKAFNGVNIALCLSFLQNGSQALQERFAIFVVLEDLSSFNSPCPNEIRYAVTDVNFTGQALRVATSQGRQV